MNLCTTQLSEELKAEAETRLERHINECTLKVLNDVPLHYPVILEHIAAPTLHLPAGVPEWLYRAVFDATSPDGALCWPIFRGSLMSRIYSIASSCCIEEPSLPLKTAMTTLGFSDGHDGDPHDKSSSIECACLTGASVAKALGDSIYRRLVVQMDKLDKCVQTSEAI